MRADKPVADLTVTDVRREADGVVSLRLRRGDDAPLPSWEPGAHIEVELGEERLRRHYSLCGQQDDDWRIAVLREPNGRGGSAYVHEMIAAGDTIRATGPRNNFALVDADRYVFVAGGIGITPILPMVRATATAGHPTTLLYGGRRRTSMAFLDEIADLPGANVYVCPEDEVGLLDLKRHIGAPDPAAAVYYCGPPPLLEAVEKQCADWPRGSLHREIFIAEERPHNPGDTFEVQLARSGESLRVDSHRTLLEALEDAGIDHPHSCRAGICGTCLTDVVDGQPEHLDDVLSDEERDSGQVILPCVSRSRSRVLVLDL